MGASYWCGSMTAGPPWTRKSVASSHPACSLMILTRLWNSVRTSNLFRGSRIAGVFFFSFYFLISALIMCVCVPTERNRKAKADHPGIMKPPPPHLWWVQRQASPSVPQAGRRSVGGRGRGWRWRLAESDQPPQTRSSNSYLLR